MFDALSNRLSSIFQGLKSKGSLTEKDLDVALRDIRVALLEADVALSVVKDFIANLKEKAIGEEVIKSISPGQMVVKLVHDALVDILKAEQEGVRFTKPPTVFMMVGLQGSGKTTSTGKLALYIQKKYKKKVLMVSTDVYRPAAREQLAVLGRQIQVDTFPISTENDPKTLAKMAHGMAKDQGYDVLLVDTAGRLHIDDALMKELESLQTILSPHHALLVADAMTGQDAVTMAQAFQKTIALTGVILTRMDGDARAGAALSLRHVTGCPLQFVGTGEKLNDFELFEADRVARRILDMGDVVSLVEKTAEIVSEEEAAKMAQSMEKGTFDMNDLQGYLKQMTKMGGMGKLLGMIPGAAKLKGMIPSDAMDDKVIHRQLAIIQSMTKEEKKNVSLMNGSRRKRVAVGSGTSIQDVNRLLKAHRQMADMMKKMARSGPKGLMRGQMQNLFRR